MDIAGQSFRKRTSYACDNPGQADGLSGHAYGLWVNYKAKTQDEVTRIESEWTRSRLFFVVEELSSEWLPLRSSLFALFQLQVVVWLVRLILWR